MASIQGDSRSQTILFPVSLEDLIPDDHLVRVIDAYVGKLDLLRLGFEKAVAKGRGDPLTIPPTNSGFISTATSIEFARRASWGLSVSATSK